MWTNVFCQSLTSNKGEDLDVHNLALRWLKGCDRTFSWNKHCAMICYRIHISYHILWTCFWGVCHQQIHRKQHKASEMMRWEEGKWICKMQMPFVGIEEKTIEIASSCWKTFEIGMHLEAHTEGQFKANWIVVQRENEKGKWKGK